MSQASDNPRACPVCGTSGASLAVSVYGDWLDNDTPVPQDEYPYFHCSNCDALFLGQMPSSQLLAMYYDSPNYHVRQNYMAKEGEEGLSTVWWCYQRLLRPVPAKMPANKPGKHLDYGCGPGDYMMFTKSYGWDVTGVEYSEESARGARQRGLSVVLESDLSQLPDAHFDMITMNHSLEHVPDPVATVRALAAKLRPGGTFYIELPCIDTLEYKVFGQYCNLGAPLHLQCFRDKTMEYVGRQVGLELVKCRDNYWFFQTFTGSFLGYLRWRFGIRVGRSRTAWVCLAAFPAMIFVTLASRLFGLHSCARRYFLKKP